MSIGSVVRRGSSVYIYDENGRQIGTIGVAPNDTLKGYTSTTVSIQRGSMIYIYDEKGRQKGATPA